MKYDFKSTPKEYSRFVNVFNKIASIYHRQLFENLLKLHTKFINKSIDTIYNAQKRN